MKGDVSQHPLPATGDEKVMGLVLAAGRGSRLGNAGHAVPKCLLEIARRPLIEHQLDALAEAGVGPTIVVAGYAADEVRETVGIRAELVVNTRWNTTNSLYSLWMARDRIEEAVLILNSDVLFCPEVLDRVLAQPGDAVAFDGASGRAREQMKVRADRGRVVDMGKDLAADAVSGENVGIIKLTATTARDLFEVAERMIRSGETTHWLASAVRELAVDHSIAAVDVAGLPWIEIDFPTDLNRARKEVWPAIERATRKRRGYWKVARWVALVVLVVSTAAVGSVIRGAEGPSWDVVLIEGLEHTKISAGEHDQSWWLLARPDTGIVHVRGPGPVRIDSRLLDPNASLGQYVLDVQLDGERLDWYKFTTNPSKTYVHPSFEVGQRQRIKLDLPEGPHEIRVALVVPADKKCLLRIRQIEDPSDE
jgi:choline kinase